MEGRGDLLFPDPWLPLFTFAYNAASKGALYANVSNVNKISWSKMGAKGTRFAFPLYTHSGPKWVYKGHAKRVPFAPISEPKWVQKGHVLRAPFYTHLGPYWVPLGHVLRVPFTPKITQIVTFVQNHEICFKISARKKRPKGDTRACAQIE